MDQQNRSTALIVRELRTENGVVEVRQRPDGYVNVTQLCQAAGKEYSNWWLNKSSKEYVEALSLDLGIPRSELLVSIYGGDPYQQGTWAHPEIAIVLKNYFFSEKFRGDPEMGKRCVSV